MQRYMHEQLSCLRLNLQDEVEAEMRRLKQELIQMMDMYSTACKEALSEKEKVHKTTFFFWNFMIYRNIKADLS